MGDVREVRPDEIDAAMALVRQVFREYVRPDLGEEGWQKLLEYVDAEAAHARRGEHVMLGAFEGEVLVGVLEIRRGRHVSLLAVAGEYLGQGVARALFERCLAICADQEPRPECLTVNASRFALGVYRRFGFVEQGEEMVVDGIRFTPMMRKL